MHKALQQRTVYIHKNIVLDTAVWLHECIRILQIHCLEVIAVHFTVKFQNFYLSLNWRKFKIIIIIIPPSPLQGNKIKSYVTLLHVSTGVTSCMFTAISAFSIAPVFIIVSSDFSLWEITANLVSESD
jgi:hypothetical protein